MQHDSSYPDNLFPVPRPREGTSDRLTVLDHLARRLYLLKLQIDSEVFPALTALMRKTGLMTWSNLRYGYIRSFDTNIHSEG